MSVRRPRSNGVDPATAALQGELIALKQTAQEANRADAIAAALPEGASNAPSFDQLAPVEQAAASLGVHPEAWRPIAFMNNMHHDALIKQNALDDELARRIEAYKMVAQKS